MTREKDDKGLDVLDHLDLIHSSVSDIEVRLGELNDTLKMMHAALGAMAERLSRLQPVSNASYGEKPWINP